ncbi:MAG: hypothetical protein HOE90_12815 [Bacteriovoracaceae bacterium]|jgi:endonuclease/exonuclease/phosphatase family metal-dependent hydrolase|nr:hypothetical protein [Bacteriovoracaceae bacterium]
MYNPQTLNVLSFNVAGLPLSVGTPFVKERAPLLRKKLAELYQWGKVDVVLIQEAWARYFKKNLLRACFPFAVGGNEFTLGSGLMILSRFPITECEYIPFDESPKFPKSNADGEWLVKKGFYLAQIDHPTLKKVWISNTHLTANYAPFSHSFEDYRKSQVKQLFEETLKKAGGDPLIIGGDINMGPGKFSMDEIWTQLPGLYPDLRRVPVDPKVVTYCKKNFYNRSWVDPCQLDHIFHTNHFSSVDYQIMFQEMGLINEKTAAQLSDHYGLFTQLQIKLKQLPPPQSI